MKQNQNNQNVARVAGQLHYAIKDNTGGWMVASDDLPNTHYTSEIKDAQLFETEADASARMAEFYAEGHSIIEVAVRNTTQTNAARDAGRYPIGSEVICNGFPGTVIAVTEYGMIEVRLASGDVCVDANDELTVQPAPKFSVELRGGIYKDSLPARDFAHARTIARNHVGEDMLERTLADGRAEFWHPDSTETAIVSHVVATNASAETTAQTPNYRIYDRTGGGVTEDIYADSLEDAIEQGREWIEAGDWSGCGGDDEDGGKTYRTIELECCVGDIVRDEDGEIDDRATFDGAHDCSGSYAPDMPECEMSENEGAAKVEGEIDGEGHMWRQPYSVVGGCKENPGVWSAGGTGMTYHSVCRLCGCHKHTSDPGCQRNPDEATETVTIKPRDEESEAWLKRTHEEDGWIPEWLAEMLGCSPSVKMTEEQAREYVAWHDDSDDLDDDDLEHAFAAIFNRRADDEDRAQGLWSHLCASA